jgi:hypothetical protein
MDKVDAILFWISAHWELVTGIGISIYEFIVRKVATQKDLTLVGNLKKILDFFVKNKRKPSTEDQAVAGDSSKNVVVLNRDEHI